MDFFINSRGPVKSIFPEFERRYEDFVLLCLYYEGECPCDTPYFFKDRAVEVFRKSLQSIRFVTMGDQ